MKGLTFSRKKIIKKKLCVPTLPKIFRPVTRNTLIFLFGLMKDEKIITKRHFDIANDPFSPCVAQSGRMHHHFENHVDLDQRASNEAIWSGSALVLCSFGIHSINWNPTTELAGNSSLMKSAHFIFIFQHTGASFYKCNAPWRRGHAKYTQPQWKVTSKSHTLNKGQYLVHHKRWTADTSTLN